MIRGLPRYEPGAFVEALHDAVRTGRQELSQATNLPADLLVAIAQWVGETERLAARMEDHDFMQFVENEPPPS